MTLKEDQPTNNELTDEQNPEKKSRFRKFFISCFLLVLFLIIVVCFFISSLFSKFVVSGNSMEPTFQNNDTLIISSLPYLANPPKSNDVIVYKISNNSEKNYLKRIIGVPGDMVKIENGKVFLNGTELNEPYKNGKYTYGDKETILRENEYYVLGDNREPNASQDSRELGPIKRDAIVGKVWRKI